MRYALTTQVRVAGVKWRSRWIDGSATLTIVASTMIISWPKQTTTRVSQRRQSLTGVSYTDRWIFILPPRRNYVRDDHYNMMITLLTAWIIRRVGMILI